MRIDLFKRARYVTVAVDDAQDNARHSPRDGEDAAKCPSCGSRISVAAFEAAHKVCPRCGFHARLSPRERLLCTVDPGSEQELFSSLRTVNPIDFPGYDEKIEGIRSATGRDEAVWTGRAAIDGLPIMLAVMDSEFMMASMGSVVGEKITRLFESATQEGLPVVIFTCSGGARMQEGMFSLMQMAKTSGAAGRHGAAGNLYVTVITDPTTGGVTASFAMLGDVIIAEPGATIGFAGRRVIEGTISQKLPSGFQTAEFQLEHGFVDAVVERGKMRAVLSQILRIHTKGGAAL